MAKLPASVQEIADVIGEAQALRLVDMLPRRRATEHPAGLPMLYVPKRIPPSHRLVEILGRADAEKLSRHFGGERLSPATCELARKRSRNLAIAEAARDGKPVSGIAQDFGLHVRQVRRIVDATDVPSVERERGSGEDRPQPMSAAA